jgi:mannose-6-phosphate isomerase-like protein (cupin superfamily)
MDVAHPFSLRVSPDDTRPRSNDPGHPSVLAMAHGSMQVRWFRPQLELEHKPHDRDEVYFVVTGTAMFRRGNMPGPFDEGNLGTEGEQRTAVRPGDVLFVPAGAPHKFDEMSEDLAVWAVFYGPEGGEAP